MARRIEFVGYTCKDKDIPEETIKNIIAYLDMCFDCQFKASTYIIPDFMLEIMEEGGDEHVPF